MSKLVNSVGKQLPKHFELTFELEDTEFRCEHCGSLNVKDESYDSDDNDNIDCGITCLDCDGWTFIRTEEN